MKDLEKELKKVEEKFSSISRPLREKEQKLQDLKPPTLNRGIRNICILIAFLGGIPILIELVDYGSLEDITTESLVAYSFVWLIWLFLYFSEMMDKKNLNKDIKELKEKKAEIQEIITNIETQIKTQKAKENAKKAKENAKKAEEFRMFLIGVKSEFDKNGDSTIDVIQHNNEFYKMLKFNQLKILEMEKSENRDFTKQFVKVSNFLVEKEKNLQEVFSRIEELNSISLVNKFKSNLIDQIQFYNVFRLNSLLMLSSFIDDDRITFYTIYEKFDKLGVWNTHLENQLLIKLDLLNTNLEKLISTMINMTEVLVDSINDLIMVTEENTDSLSDKLSSIESSLNTANLINSINTYQNYRMNKNLKS